MFAEYQLAADMTEAARIVPWAGGAKAFPRELHNALNQHRLPFSKNRTLLLEGQGCRAVYCVLDGWLALSKALQEGQNQIIDFALPGDIVDPVAADGKTSSVNIEALSDGALAAMPYRSWERMTGHWPEMQRLAHLSEAAQQARRAERMLRLGKGTAEMRIAYAILEFCIRIDGTDDHETPSFHIPMTQQQLGDYVGLSSVHVCRTMRRLTRNKILAMRDHIEVRVLDACALARLAGVDREALEREILPFRA
ncbi:helix-turn-helix domain-containing protein [Roseovarius bejariae]|uniref:helix-turn-helix domain-containing protein n=1 Tax=Roseovarius bejariae TaxID=2576383 RepID=UPI001561E8D3